jgi:hypothetical protein
MVTKRSDFKHSSMQKFKNCNNFNFLFAIKLSSDFFTRFKYLQIIRKLYSFLSIALVGMDTILPVVREITPIQTYNQDCKRSNANFLLLHGKRKYHIILHSPPSFIVASCNTLLSCKHSNQNTLH